MTSLDVQGGFHASTADYLRLGENGRFDASVSANSLLSAINILMKPKNHSVLLVILSVLVKPVILPCQLAGLSLKGLGPR